MVRRTIHSYGRWLPALIVAMTLVAILVGGFALHYVERRLVASAGESLTLAAVDIADKLDMQMAERYGDIQLLSRSLEFQGHDYPVMEQRLLALLETYPVYRWAGITDAKGQVLVATERTSKGRDLSGEPGFLAVRVGYRAVVQDAAPDDEGVLAVTFVSPLHDARGAFLGAVISQVGLPVLEDAFARAVNALQAQWGTGARIEYLFLDHDGKVFVDSLLREEGQINLKQQGVPSAQLLDAAPAGFVEEWHGRRQVDIVTGYAQTKGTEDLKGLRWGVLVRVDRSDILAPIQTVLWRLGAAGLVVGAPLLGLLLWVTGRLRNEHARAQQDSARAQAAEATARQMMDTLDASRDGLFIFDAKTLRFFYVNQGALEQTGYSREELLAMTPVGLKPEFDEPQFRALLARVRAEADPTLTFTTVHHRKDGGDVPVEIVLQYLAPQGQPGHYIAVVRDITERQRAEQALHESKECFRQVAENIKEVFWVTDPAKNTILYISPAYEDIWGHTRESLYAAPRMWLEVVHPADRARVLQAALTKQRAGDYDETYRILRPDGSERWIRDRAFPVTDDTGQVYRITGIAEDITERQRVEQALAEKTHELSDFIEQATVSMHWVGPDGIILWANQTELDLLGYTRDGYIGHHIADFHVDQPVIQDILDRLSRDEAVQEYGARLRSKDGSIKDVLIDSSVLWKDGQFLHTRCFTRDITERKQAEAALQALQDQIRQMQKMEALGQLAGGVAHDFNNILTAILGNAEIAHAKLAADHPSRLNLTRILDASDRAARLVQQILTFTHQQPCARTVLALSPVVHEVLALLRATLPAGIELTTTSDAATPPVLADATQIHQVVMNLCTNAWHALGDHPGFIAVDLAPVTLAQPLRTLHTTLPLGRYVHLSVRDTGCGMAPETVARIFDPFFTTKPVGQGTGLGLSVVHGIVRGHEGAIVVDSHPGQGTTVHLYFPAAAAPARASEPAGAPRISRQGRSRHLLYLDDEEMLVELFRSKFEPLGYQVTGCTRPAEALDAVRADPGGFDVVVTDYNMPEMSGLEVARALACLRADLPVVLVSGYLSPTVRAAALAVGVTEIVAKPITLQQLGDVVTRLLDIPPHP